MKKLRNIAVAAALVLSITVLAGCTTYDNFKAAFFGEQGEGSETIKIGVLEPQTGNDSQYGMEEIRGIELAHKLYPTVLDKSVELVYADTQSSIYVTETAVPDLIAKKPAIVLGSYGDTVTLVASQLLGEAKIPAISITTTNPLITTNNPYYFSVSFNDASQGKAVAHYIVEKLKQNKAAVIRSADDDTTTDLISKFKGRMRRLTKDQDCVPVTIDVTDDVKDYTDYLQEIKDAKVKVVFMPVNLTIAEKVFQQADKMGLHDIQFVGPKDWHGDDLLQIAMKYPKIKISVASDLVIHAEDAENSDTETTAIYEQFVKAYQDEYLGAEPTDAAALAFDSYLIAINAIEDTESTDPDVLREAILTKTNLSGASGKITFDEAGEPKKPINIDIIQDGKYVSVYTVK